MKNMSQWVVIFSVMGLMLCVRARNAGAEEINSFDLGMIMVTPTTSGSAIENLPNSVNVITKEDIEMSNARHTTDLLQSVPGIFIRRTGQYGRSDVDIRGLGDSGRQIGVFIDGRPDKMGIYGCSVTHTLPMNNVERVEIIRGPESVLYGSEAFGGVINIITRRSSKPFEGSLTADFSSFNTQHYRLQQGCKFKKLDYFISADHVESDGFNANSSFNSRDFTGQIGYTISKDDDISFSGKYFDGTKYEPLPSVAGTWNDYARGSMDMTYTHTGSAVTSSLKVYRTFGEHRFSDRFHSKDFTNGAMLHSAIKTFHNNTLSAGIDTRYQVGTIINTAPASFIGRYDKTEYGVYFQDEQTLFDRLRISAGARYNHDEFAGDAVTPKTGVVIDVLKGTIVRGAISRGFRAPQINDLFLWSGNRDLKPEKILNREVGIRQRIGDIAYIDIAGYSMKGSDLIQVKGNKKENIGNFEFRGIETQLDAIITKDVLGSLTYTFLDPGDNTTGRPGNVYGASLQYGQGKYQGIVSGQYISKYYAGEKATNKIPDYALLNMKLNYVIIEPLRVFIAVDNITDRDYQIYSGGLYDMPGRSYTGGITYTF